jgi:hypothetical protein
LFQPTIKGHNLSFTQHNSIMKLAILSSVLGVTCAFAPAAQTTQRFTALREGETDKAETDVESTPFFASSAGGAAGGTS